MRPRYSTELKGVLQKDARKVITGFLCHSHYASDNMSDEDEMIPAFI